MLHYQEYGDKSAPLMVFLHGGGVSSWMWDRQIQHFTHFHCLVPDLPEHGMSKGKHFSIRSCAETIVQLIEERGRGKKVIVIGFSLGAQVMVQLLSIKPNLIDFAIINSALVRPLTFAKAFIRPSIRLSYPLIRNRWFSSLQAKTLYVGKDYFEKYYEESCQMTVDTLVRVMQENMTFEIPKDFCKANGRILVTVGEKERAMMKKSALDIVKSNKNCLGILIPNTGHGASLVIPDFFNNMIEAWITEGTWPKECKVIMED